MVKFTPPLFAFLAFSMYLRTASGSAYDSPNASPESQPAELISDCKPNWLPVSVAGKGVYCAERPVCSGFKPGNCPSEGKCVIVAKESGVYGCVEKDSAPAASAGSTKCNVAPDTPAPTPAPSAPKVETEKLAPTGVTEQKYVPPAENQVTEEKRYVPAQVSEDAPAVTHTPLDTTGTDAPSVTLTPEPTTLKPSASPHPATSVPPTVVTPAPTSAPEPTSAPSPTPATSTPQTTVTPAPTSQKPIETPAPVYSPEPTTSRPSATPKSAETPYAASTPEPEDKKAALTPTPCKTKADGTPEDSPGPSTTPAPTTSTPTPAPTTPTPTPAPTTPTPTPAPTTPTPTPASTPCKSALGNPIHSSVDQAQTDSPTSTPTPAPTTSAPATSRPESGELMEEYYGTVEANDDTLGNDLRRSLRRT